MVGPSHRLCGKTVHLLSNYAGQFLLSGFTIQPVWAGATQNGIPYFILRNAFANGGDGARSVRQGDAPVVYFDLPRSHCIVMVV